MTVAAPELTLEQALRRRMAIEAQAAATGRTFRRHPGRMAAERWFVKPALKLFLSATGLMERGKRNALAVQCNTVQLRLPSLPADFEGYRILHLSDLHIDALPGLADAVASVLTGVDADLCLMTGDYRFDIEGPCEAAVQGMRTVLSAVRARDGVFSILGNHDPSEMAFHLDRLGVRMLINASEPIIRRSSAIWLMGVDDSYDYRCDDLRLAAATVPNDCFRVLMAHTPDLYAQAEAAKVHLYLSGHTHAGQVRLPAFGAVISNSDAPREYTRGLWRHRDMTGYTSHGAGCSMLPIRFNCQPEVTVFELRRS